MRSWTEKCEAADRECGRLAEERRLCVCSRGGGEVAIKTTSGSRSVSRMGSRTTSYHHAASSSSHVHTVSEHHGATGHSGHEHKHNGAHEHVKPAIVEEIQ